MKIQIPRTLSGGALALALSVVGITDASAQLIDTYAGRGPYIAPIAASAANITPWPIALAPSGSVYFADRNSVYRFDPNAATVTTVAGNHTNGYSGDTGPATNAQIGNASGLALDSSGNL